MTAQTLIAALNILEQQHALLFFLLDLSLKSTLVLLLAFTIQFLIRDRSPSVKSIVWMGTFAALILLPLFHQVAPKTSLAFATHSEFGNYAETLQASAVFVEQVNSLAGSMLGVLISYFLVGSLLAIYLLSGLLKVIVLTRFAKPFRNEIAQQKLQRLQQLNGFSRPIELLVSAKVSSPLTWGLWRHKIIFPLAANGWSAELLEQTLSHELGHVQRGDWILQIVARAAISLYWINPLAWLAHRRLLIETEKACDDVAVENTGSPLDYAQNLLELANSLSSQCSIAAPALLGVQSSLSQRIRHILKQEINTQSSDTSNILPSLFLAALVIAPFSTLSIQIQKAELPNYIQKESRVILVSYFPNDSRGHYSLMAEFE